MFHLVESQTFDASVRFVAPKRKKVLKPRCLMEEGATNSPG